MLYAYGDYDKANPIYGKTREDNIYGGSLSLFYKNLLSSRAPRIMSPLAPEKQSK